jgi:hypothetical protein
MNKAPTIEKYADGITMLRQAEILTVVSFIAGFPGESRDTHEASLRFVRMHHPDFCRIQLWYCEPANGEPQRGKYGLEGCRYAWKHMTADHEERMRWVEEAIETVHSLWVPQWSFDFWIIPCLLGRGITPDQFKYRKLGPINCSRCRLTRSRRIEARRAGASA